MSADATSYAMAQKIGWVLLHTLWQGLLIGLGFAALRRILRQHSANARYAVSCFALTLMVAAPIVTLLGKPSGIESTRSAISAEDVGHFNSEVAGMFENESRTLSTIRSSAERLGRMTPFIAAAWLMGVAVFSGRLARSCFEVRTLRLKSHEAVEPGWIERLADLRCRLEITRPVLLLKSTLVQVPTVIGWFRPVILLPIATITGLSPEQLDAILAHELAHVRRHDYLVNAVQCAVETLFFYHPIVWWISRCIREERELCCDDLVIKVCGDRIIYARALATLEESRAGLLEIAFAANGGSLLNRIRRLLGAPQEGPVTAAQTAGFALLALGVACLAAGAYVLLAAPKYEAAARIRFEWRAPVGVQLQGRNMKASGPDPMSFQTEAELIQSEAVLGKVIDEQNLQVLWGKRYGEGKSLDRAAAISLLRGKLTSRPIPNTSLIEVRVSSESPVEAASIANAIARVHRDERLRERADLASGTIKALEERFEEQSRKIRSQQAYVDELRQKLGINSPVSYASPNSGTTVEMVRKIETLRIEKESEYLTEETLLNGLNKLPHDQLVQVLPTVKQDSLLNALVEQLQLGEQHLVTLRKEYGPGHPHVVSVGAQIEDLNKKINSRVEGIMVGLTQRTASLKEGLTSLQKELEKATLSDSENEVRMRPYLEAKRQVEELERFGQVLSMKIASEKIEEALPKSELVQIVDSAVPPFRPAHNGRSHGVGLIVLGLLLDALGLAFLRTGQPPVAPTTAPALGPISSSAGKA